MTRAFLVVVPAGPLLGGRHRHGKLIDIRAFSRVFPASGRRPDGALARRRAAAQSITPDQMRNPRFGLSSCRTTAMRVTPKSIAS